MTRRGFYTGPSNDDTRLGALLFKMRNLAEACYGLDVCNVGVEDLLDVTKIRPLGVLGHATRTLGVPVPIAS